jgi:hypothetical protein
VNYVLVKCGPTKPMYNVVTIKNWDKWQRRHGPPISSNAATYWHEVARGTYTEMVALAKLMPDPKTLSFD